MAAALLCGWSVQDQLMDETMGQSPLCNKLDTTGALRSFLLRVVDRTALVLRALLLQLIKGSLSASDLL